MLNSLTTFLFSIFAILSLAVTSACVPDGTAARGTQSYSAGQAAGGTAQPAGEFRLGSGDRIRINVFGADQDYVLIRRGGQDEEVRVPFASAAPIFPGDIVRVPGRIF